MTNMIKYDSPIAYDDRCWSFDARSGLFAFLGLWLMYWILVVDLVCGFYDVRPFRQQQQQQQQQLRGNSNSQFSLIEPWTFETNQHISISVVFETERLQLTCHVRSSIIIWNSSQAELECKQSQRWPRQRGHMALALKWIEFANYKTASATARV